MRPSTLLSLEDDSWAAYCLDTAIWTIGSTIQSDLNNVEAKNPQEEKRKKDQILRRWIPEATKARKFKDPGAR